VGGTKNVRVDRVAALAPDLVLANKEENEREEVEAIRGALPEAQVLVTEIATLAEALGAIREVGALTQRSEAADALAGRIEARFGAGLGALETPSAQTAPRVAYLIWHDPIMVTGGGTFIGDMLRVGGFENAFEAEPRYPSTSLEALRAMRLDALLLSSEPFPFAQKHAAAFEQALPGTRALLVDGEAFSWYGPRLLATPAHLGDVRAALR
jgi:ABC-type Fe3+-hydroxamate transport system substrate-binding protein